MGGFVNFLSSLIGPPRRPRTLMNTIYEHGLEGVGVPQAQGAHETPGTTVIYCERCDLHGGPFVLSLADYYRRQHDLIHHGVPLGMPGLGLPSGANTHREGLSDPFSSDVTLPDGWEAQR